MIFLERSYYQMSTSSSLIIVYNEAKVKSKKLTPFNWEMSSTGQPGTSFGSLNPFGPPFYWKYGETG